MKAPCSEFAKALGYDNDASLLGVIEYEGFDYWLHEYQSFDNIAHNNKLNKIQDALDNYFAQRNALIQIFVEELNLNGVYELYDFESYCLARNIEEDF